MGKDRDKIRILRIFLYRCCVVFKCVYSFECVWVFVGKVFSLWELGETNSADPYAEPRAQRKFIMLSISNHAWKCVRQPNLFLRPKKMPAVVTADNSESRLNVPISIWIFMLAPCVLRPPASIADKSCWTNKFVCFPVDFVFLVSCMAAEWARC